MSEIDASIKKNKLIANLFYRFFLSSHAYSLVFVIICVKLFLRIA
jgi:hypothetical protein